MTIRLVTDKKRLISKCGLYTGNRLIFRSYGLFGKIRINCGTKGISIIEPQNTYIMSLRQLPLCELRAAEMAGKGNCFPIKGQFHFPLFLIDSHGLYPFCRQCDLADFLAERCIPRQRAGLREYLEALGLDEYDPFAIIEKTGGRMAEDQQWLTIEVLK